MDLAVKEDGARLTFSVAGKSASRVVMGADPFVPPVFFRVLRRPRATPLREPAALFLLQRRRIERHQADTRGMLVARETTGASKVTGIDPFFPIVTGCDYKAG